MKRPAQSQSSSQKEAKKNQKKKEEKKEETKEMGWRVISFPVKKKTEMETSAQSENDLQF